ncbi:MAG TPA: hypothetical protein DCP57_08895, partial [Gammaproteobacteria bacterium]|nr:hypothetical protein [Gammaproteobacteria bacterium]
PAVAVRSSANAEDLPGLSFAGQQETYLNVRGADEVSDAVKRCWASLWTAQAISYRHQNGIPQDSVAMAVVVQVMVPSQVSGILFTANPTTGERSEMIINASFGLGEAVVSGQVTPDTYIMDKASGEVREQIIGPKQQKIVSDAEQGVRLEDVAESDRALSSLSGERLAELLAAAKKIENLFDGLPQDIEWAYGTDGALALLQSRPITNLPVQPIEVVWEPTPPAIYVSRRQIVENMPDPICPLFEELYLTEGLESSKTGKRESMQVGGGPLFVTVNGYAYMRFDFKRIVERREREKGNAQPVTEAEIEAEEQRAAELESAKQAQEEAIELQEKSDLELFLSEIPSADADEFRAWAETQDAATLAHRVSMPESDNPTYSFATKTAFNNRQLAEWHDETAPRLKQAKDKWRQLDLKTASDDELLAGITELSIEEGRYWSTNASHSFGVAKSTDDQLQCFLRETLPDEQFISGQFLSGIYSKSMEANGELFEIAKLVRAEETLVHLVAVTPLQFLMPAFAERKEAEEVLAAIDRYLNVYGHQGYSMDFVEPTQVEDPTALLASLKAMVMDPDYNPKHQDERARRVREEKFEAVSALLSGLPYWQFRYRLWLALRYNYIREEVAFLFGYGWSVLRPMAAELGQRMVDQGTFNQADDVYFLVSAEIKQAIQARSQGKGLPEFGKLAAERRELREARKRHHPPGTLPAEAREDPGIKFKETQILNDDDSNLMRGFAVSSGQITAPASVITGPSEFEKMVPGSILVSPLTTPAWTQLFAHAAGLVTDMGSILAHGSIVAREYGIPAVLGVGNGTVRIQHGQTITIDGDAGTVIIHEDD